MMKRTPIQFVEDIDRALAWRKKELTTLKFTVSRTRREQQEMLLRAAVCLLYAHWEGFIKDAATKYIHFVVSQDLLLQDVAIHFAALGLQSCITKAGNSKKATLRTGLVHTILNEQNIPFRVPWDDAIDTGSNLKTDQLTEILCLVGVDPINYQSKGPLLDERLLKNRNAIAHGRGVPIALQDYNEMHEVVIELLDRFRDDLEQAAISASYRRVP